jgi:hypothetical protein
VSDAGLEFRACGSLDQRARLLVLERRDASMATQDDGVRGSRSLSTDGRMSRNLELVRSEGEERAEDPESKRDRRVRGSHSRRRAKDAIQIGVSRTCVPKSDADFLDTIRSAVNAYNNKLDLLPPSKMYDVELQRDMAREALLEIESILALRKVWKRDKKRG